MLTRVRERQELRLAAALGRADRPLAVGWWGLLAARGLLPAAFAVATGVLVTDLIVVLDGARVAEAGSHEELLARDGRYADLYRIQAAGYR